MPLTNFRPESFEEFTFLLERNQKLQTRCLKCQLPFTSQNTHTGPGWRDTQIIGWCEDCFDETFEESDPIMEKKGS